MGSLLRIGAAASAAVMVCVAAGGAGAGCGGSTFTQGSDAGSDGHGGGSSGSSSGGASSSGGSGGSRSGSGGGSGGSSSGSGGGSGGSSSSGSGGGSSSSGSGGSSGGAPSPCPTTQPGGPSSCMPDGLECEYGKDPQPGCNLIIQCLNGTWAKAGNSYCPSGTCPAHYVDVPQGQSCMPNGLDCAYAEGQCNCSYSLPVGGPNPTSQCFHPTGCPEPRPRVGQGCTQDGLECDYGACTGGIAETCTDGYWHWTMVPCPG